MLATVLLGQACDHNIRFHSVGGGQSDKHSLQGNGDSYGGKPIKYSRERCSDLAANGQPLPKREIFVFSNNTAQIVRENCTDLDRPVDIQYSALTFAPGGLSYQGNFYDEHPEYGDFGVVAEACPAGMSPSGGARTNLILGSQNLTDYSVWFNHVGIATALDGSLASLFRYRITRDDPSFLDYWRRIHQSDFPLQGGKTYAYSFLAEAGNVNEAYFNMYQKTVSSLALVINLNSGQVMEYQNQGNITYSVTSSAVGKGRFVTIFFTINQTGPDTVIGITPNGVISHTPAVGDFIYATAIQLEDVSTYCQ